MLFRRRSLANIRRSAFEKLAVIEAASASSEERLTVGQLLEDYKRPQSQASNFLDGVFKGHAPISRVPMVSAFPMPHANIMFVHKRT